MPSGKNTDIKPLVGGGYVARHVGKGARRRPLVREDTAAQNEPVQGGWQSPVTEDRR